MDWMRCPRILPLACLSFLACGDGDGEAHWSPEGRRIVFSSEQDSNPGWLVRRPEIYVMNADGSDVRKLTNSLEGSSTPRWSPVVSDWKRPR